MLPGGGTMGSFRSMKEEVILLVVPVPAVPPVVVEDAVGRSFPNGENVEPPVYCPLPTVPNVLGAPCESGGLVRLGGAEFGAKNRGGGLVASPNEDTTR